MTSTNKLVLSLYIPTFFLSFCSGLLLPILPIFVRSFGVPYSVVGIVLAGEAIGTLIADIPAGSLLRRFDRKWIMIGGVLIAGLAVLGLAAARIVWLVLLLRIIAGTGIALWNVSRHAYLVEVTSKQERGRAIALFGGTNRLGVFAGPASAGLIATLWSLELVFVVFMVLSVVTAVLVLVFVKPAEVERVVMKGHAVASHHVLGILRSHYRVLLSAGIGQVFAQMLRASRQVIIPLYGSSVGLDVQAVGTIMSASSFIDMSLFYPAGVLMDRLGRKYAIVPCFLIQAIGMACVPLAGGFVSLLACAAIIGFGNGLGSGTMMTLGADLAPEASLGEFLGVWRLIGDTGATGGPVVVGAVADVLSLSMSALVMSGVGFIAVAVFAFMVPETLQKPRSSRAS